MSYYTFKIPMFRKSTKKIDIYDVNNKLVGQLQRVYNNIPQKILDNIFSKDMFINVLTYDSKGSLFCKGNEENWIKPYWKVIRNEVFIYNLNNKTRIKTNPRMEFEYDGNKYLIKKDFGDKTVYLVTGDRNIGFIKYDKIIGAKTIEVNLNEECDIHFLEIICMYYIFFLKD